MSKIKLILGPCVMESHEFIMDIAGQINDIVAPFSNQVDWVFKSSYDKANRTSIDSFRGPGIEKGLETLQSVKSTYNLDVLTDVHSPEQAIQAGQVVDYLQIPAFLCRQTDILVAAAQTGKKVNVKKGQFLSPQEMQHVVNKLLESGADAENIYLCERGTTFGYNTLVVDMRSLKIMTDMGCKVIFDATHAVQAPGGLNGKSGGNRAYVPTLSRAALAVGIEGIFAEVHPDPDNAKSDGPNMLHLNKLSAYIEQVVAYHELNQKYPNNLY